MVRITSLLAGVLAFVSAAQACGGWYQCKHASGRHCCVIDSGKGPHGCPAHCDGGDTHPPECVSQTVGNSRHP
ncbi:hypothetical protein E4U55_001291, partial [Claviceps digitariae]